jgi:hypothetical protein
MLFDVDFSRDEALLQRVIDDGSATPGQHAVSPNRSIPGFCYCYRSPSPRRGRPPMTLILSNEDVEKVLTMRECIDATS